MAFGLTQAVSHLEQRSTATVNHNSNFGSEQHRQPKLKMREDDRVAKHDLYDAIRLTMACAVPEAVDKQLTCAICIEQFKEPKVLPCLHTYCKGCLVKLVRKQGAAHVITCPECRQDTKVVNGDVGKLQPNFWVNNFMTLRSMQDKTSSRKPLICEHCNSGDSAVSRCTDCSVFMCEFCVSAHKRINAFIGHKILFLSEVQKLGSKALVKPVICVKHTGETLKLFCETCQKTICRDCTIVDHREHKYNFVSDVAEKERKIVEAALEKTKAKHSAVEGGVRAVQTMESRIKAKTAEISEKVDTFFDEQLKALQYLRANLKHEVSTQGQLKLKELGSQREVLTLSLAQLGSSIEFTARALEGGDDIALLSMKQELIQRLTQLNTSQYQCKPCKSDYLTLQVQKTIWNIGKMATLCDVPTDPQKCAVSVVGGEEGVMYETMVGQPVDFMLITKDGMGNKETEGGHLVKVDVTCNYQRKSKQKQKNSVVHVDDNGNGSYSFSFRPVDVGQVTMTVLVRGQHVDGSPFKWQVNPVLHIENGNSDTQFGYGTWTSAVYVSGATSSRSENSASVFKTGVHSWKLKLVSVNAQRRGQREITIGVKKSRAGPFGGFQRSGVLVNKEWSWHYEAITQNSWRSDDEKCSINSVQDKDVFTVFLNLETKKLVIYNVRSKQSEIFTGLEGGPLVPVISPYYSGRGESRSFEGPFLSLID